jgi:hypothetical protein
MHFFICAPICTKFYLCKKWVLHSVLSSNWNPWKFNRNFSLSCCQEYIYLGGSLEYQFAVAPSREIMSDLARVSSSPPDEAMAVS